MLGWRARIGVLVPPGNPTVEPELYRMAPIGVSFHFARLDSSGSASAPGDAVGMEERTRAYVDSLPAPTRTLAAVNPAVVGLAFTAASYANGFRREQMPATRDYTGGSLGYTPERYHGGSSVYALQFSGKTTWYLIVLAVWSAGLYVWYRVDRTMLRYALEAISEDEDAAAATGVHVTVEKLKITVLSAVMTALAGALYCQYQMFISPDTVSGISISLQMVFAVVVGGIYVPLGPTVGAVITILLAEVLRISFGTRAVGWDNAVYGILLVMFIVFLPKGILGSLLDLRQRSGRTVR